MTVEVAWLYGRKVRGAGGSGRFAKRPYGLWDRGLVMARDVEGSGRFSKRPYGLRVRGLVMAREFGGCGRFVKRLYGVWAVWVSVAGRAVTCEGASAILGTPSRPRS